MVGLPEDYQGEHVDVSAGDISMIAAHTTRSSEPRMITDLNGDLALIGCWLFERSLVRIRWAAIPLCLVLIPLFPSLSVPLVVALVLMIGAANAWMARLLDGDPCANRLRLVQGGATFVDWTIALGSMALFSGEVANRTPALLLLLVLTTTIRYGQVSLVISTLSAFAIVTGLLVAATITQSASNSSVVREVWLAWMLLIGVSTCIGSGLVQARSRFDDWQQERWVRYSSILPRFELGISKRESELLPLLANDELTYRQIADELDRSPETIKSHVRHLGDKLEVRGRHKVVAAARQHGLLPPMDEFDTAM